jgi:predicted O-methyltransferase YrrM
MLPVLPERAKDLLASLHGSIHAPMGYASRIAANLKRGSNDRLHPHPTTQLRRILDYNTALLPNDYLAHLESQSPDLRSAGINTGMSIGYPAWNLLYFTLLASFSSHRRALNIVETGTNHGATTIVMAQALKDMGSNSVVHTVDADADVVEIARGNVERAGLSDFVRFSCGDSIAFLKSFASSVPYIDFAFIDSAHEYQHVRREFMAIHERVAVCGGKVYFDNSTEFGVHRALRFIRAAYGGNQIVFADCSAGPPGNTIWQAT